MKKKLLSLVMFVVLAFTLASCSFFADSEAEFSIVSYPTTTYALTGQFDWANIQIKIGEKVYNKAEAEALGVEFTTPTWTEAGTYTVTLRYEGLKASFQYVVLNNLFAGGNGTKEFPYQISTPEQLDLLNASENKEMVYYVLINDIDMAGHHYDEIAEYALDLKCTDNITLDGAGFSIRNLEEPLLRNVGKVHKSGITATTVRTEGIDNNPDSVVVIKNVNIFLNQINAESCGLVCSHYYISKGTIKFEGVKTYGIINTNTINCGVYTSCHTGNLYFTDCQNYCDLINTGRESAVYVGGYLGAGSEMHFENTQNYGTVTAQLAALMVGHLQEGAKNNKVFIDDSTANYGVIRGLRRTGKVTSVSTEYESKLDEKLIFVDVNGGSIDQNAARMRLSGQCTKVSSGDMNVTFVNGVIGVSNSNPDTAITKYIVVMSYFGRTTTTNHGGQELIIYETNNVSSFATANIRALDLYNTTELSNFSFKMPAGFVDAEEPNGFTSFGEYFKIFKNGSSYAYGFVKSEVLGATYYVDGDVSYTIMGLNSKGNIVAAAVIARQIADKDKPDYMQLVLIK